MYPIMVKIDFAEVIKAGKSGKPLMLMLVKICLGTTHWFPSAQKVREAKP